MRMTSRRSRELKKPQIEPRKAKAGKKGRERGVVKTRLRQIVCRLEAFPLYPICHTRYAGSMQYEEIKKKN
jgi:hypothetical protein